MEIQKLKEELLEQKTRHYYVFIGDEIALQDVYIKQITSVANLPLVRAVDVKSIYQKLVSSALIQAKPAVYVIRNDDEFYKSSLWKSFLKMNDFKGNILILLYSGVKKSSEFCKAHDKILTVFDPINPSLLKNRIAAVTKLPLPYCEDIVKMCGGNYGRIQNELYKLSALAYNYGNNWENAYLIAKHTKLIHEEIGDIIFDFTNAIVDRDIQKAYKLYPLIMQTEDGSAIKLLTVLYNSFRNILMVQSTPPKGRTEEILGLTKGQIFVTSQKCNKYNIYEVVSIVKQIRELEKGIKIGTVEEKVAIPYLMGMIW